MRFGGFLIHDRRKRTSACPSHGNVTTVLSLLERLNIEIAMNAASGLQWTEPVQWRGKTASGDVPTEHRTPSDQNGTDLAAANGEVTARHRAAYSIALSGWSEFYFRS